MSYHENYSDEVKQAIEELKKRTYHELSPKLQKDETLYYRFLKARSFNVKNAEEMLRKHLSDRKLFDLENIDKYSPPEEMGYIYPTTFLGYDKEGCLIRYFDFGSADIRGYFHLFGLKDYIQFVASYFESDMDRLVEQSKKLGKPITTHIPIFNLDKISFYQMSTPRLLQLLYDGFQIYQDNYPERLKLAIVINAPSFFNIGYAFIKRVFASEILNKIKIFGKTGWKEELLEVIDADVLPAFLGGTRTDPDGNPLCLTFIKRGKLFQEELNKKTKKKLINKEEANILKIPRSSCSEVRLEVNEPQTQIEWEFQTKSSDIAFFLCYKADDDTNVTKIVSKHRVNTEFSPEKGSYICEKPGLYTIVFDNSFSWIHSKEVYYKIRLIKPVSSLT